jgi:nucleoid-associated protein YgaU
MPPRPKLDLPTWVQIVGIVSASAAALYYFNQVLKDWHSGVVDWRASLGIFALLILIVAVLVGGERIFQRTKRRRVALVVSVVLITAILSIPPRAYACTRDTFCAIIVNGAPSVQDLHQENDKAIGALDEFTIVLEPGRPREEMPGVHRTIWASGGDVIRNHICTGAEQSPFLFAELTLRVGADEIGSYPIEKLRPGACQAFSYLVPPTVGAELVELEIRIVFGLLGDSGSLPPRWKGTVSISSADAVQPAPATLPEPTPPSPMSAVPSPTAPAETELDATSTPFSAPAGPPESRRTSHTPACDALEVDQVPGNGDWPYTVDGGETLGDLALFFYQDLSRWVDVYAANLSVIGVYPMGMPPIHSGQLIMIPGIHTPMRYTVEAGDSLETLSKRAYGLGAECRWKTIYDHNSDVIGTDPNRLNPGQQLSIFARKALKSDQLWVLPGESMNDIALGYYLDERMRGWLCQENQKLPGGECNHIRPLDTVVLPELPPAEQHKVLRGETWKQIAEQCYGDGRGDLVLAVQKGNWRIVGYDPLFLREGQKLLLRGCKHEK